MIESLFIFVLGLIPALLSLVMLRKAEAESRERLQAAMNASAHRGLHRLHYLLSQDHQYEEGVGCWVGDLTCRFNARSTYLRCTVNPSGPCEGCSHYESIEFN